MNKTYLSQHPESMNSIGEGYGIIGTTPVTSTVGNQWACGRLWLFDLKSPPGLGCQTRAYQYLFFCQAKGWRIRSSHLCLVRRQKRKDKFKDKFE